MKKKKRISKITLNGNFVLVFKNVIKVLKLQFSLYSINKIPLSIADAEVLSFKMLWYPNICSNAINLFNHS